MTPEPEPGGGLVLIGYRATGKSTVGRIAAERLGWPFRDADEELERASGRRIPDIFREHGEEHFRELEGRTIASLTAGPRAVLATGGGAILREENRRALRRFGLVVWLTAEPKLLADRLRHSPGGRPALTSAGLLAEIADVLEARTPLYEETAHVVVPTGRRPAREVADAVLAAFASAAEVRR